MLGKYRFSRDKSQWKLRSRNVSRILGEEQGLTESSLVLIPTIILFLCVIQIVASVITRSAELNILQGEVSKGALYGNSNLGTNLTRKPLPGGGSLLIRRTLQRSHAITPFLIGGDDFETTGIAVDENS